MNNNQNNSYEKTSLICGIVSIFIFPFIFGLVAVILGILSFSKSNGNNSNQNTSAIVGIVLGIFSVLYALYVSGQL